MRLTVTHRTRYRFDQPMARLVQSLRLWPTDFEGQTVRRWSVDVEGHPAERGAAFRDGAGDWVETVAMRHVSDVTIAVEGEVETVDLTGFVKGLREKVPPIAYLRPSPMTRLNEGLRALSAEAVGELSDPLDRAHALARAVGRAIPYTPGSTESDTTAAQALEQGRGVCQDQAHALIAIARAADMPGRYVVGYLHSSSDGQAHQASHAWAELWVEGLGWVGFDAANACCPDERYVRIGSGLDSIGAAPIRGLARGAGEETLSVDVSVIEGAGQQQ
ncbi:transglutaminase-like putative cysteine protease [Palleronia aestuarii]|uniref:Transglutaminase-like putative cysteine protease n=1 Tax=Palleronia aestuarii TaxID=568105 RepID=A0A2W7N7E1_9RHOB|nr:transglutaminase family protein [Palleronia aestuarii]PZX16041.1 transglutaminase-like putative cysteine protease [Palleronia aestuarii]